jgi:hypothetical protein
LYFPRNTRSRKHTTQKSGFRSDANVRKWTDERGVPYREHPSVVPRRLAYLALRQRNERGRPAEGALRRRCADV